MSDRVQCYDPATLQYLGFLPALKASDVSAGKEGMQGGLGGGTILPDGRTLAGPMDGCTAAVGAQQLRAEEAVFPRMPDLNATLKNLLSSPGEGACGKGTPGAEAMRREQLRAEEAFFPLMLHLKANSQNSLYPLQVKEHVARARQAQQQWAHSSFEQRRQFLRVLMRYVVENQDLICRVSARESGKVLVDAGFGEILTTCEKIAWLLSEGERWLKPEYRSVGRTMMHKVARVEFEPAGVIGAIVPWNYPFHNVLNPVLSAVFAGNAAVIK
ncbi:unnamed protein product, partial [Closterium sp. Naga37s-1]